MPGVCRVLGGHVIFSSTVLICMSCVCVLSKLTDFTQPVLVLVCCFTPALKKRGVTCNVVNAARQLDRAGGTPALSVGLVHGCVFALHFFQLRFWALL